MTWQDDPSKDNEGGKVGYRQPPRRRASRRAEVGTQRTAPP